VPVGEFLHEALGNVRSIFGLKGAQNIQSLDLAPAQPVLDIARLGSYGGGLGLYDGWYIVTGEVGNVGAGTTVETQELYASGSPLNLRNDKLYLAWAYMSWGVIEAATPADFTSMAVGIQQPNLMRANTDGDVVTRLLDFTTQDLGAANAVWGNGVGASIPVNFGDSKFPTPFPLFDPCTFVWQLASSGASTVVAHFNTLVWVGRRGALPPAGW
jgi:hypothetical protein